MTRCIGACCHRVILSRGREALRVIKDVERSAEAARIWTFMRPVSLDVDEREHRCVALTDHGCALARADRPVMCTTYPYGADKPCQYCGAGSDAEARGVALVVIGAAA